MAFSEPEGLEDGDAGGCAGVDAEVIYAFDVGCSEMKGGSKEVQGQIHISGSVDGDEEHRCEGGQLSKKGLGCLGYRSGTGEQSRVEGVRWDVSLRLPAFFRYPRSPVRVPNSDIRSTLVHEGTFLM
jgi:hypothetical protein